MKNICKLLLLISILSYSQFIQAGIKSCFGQIGNAVTSKIIVSNSGYIKLTGITVSDSITSVSNSNATLGIIESQDFIVTYNNKANNVNAGQFINQTKVAGSDKTGAGVTDIDGNVYKTVLIDGQEWMADNLKVTRYRNGDKITTGLKKMDWRDATTGAYAVMSDISMSESAMKAKYGLLYNFHAVEDPRGLAPEGWRVATDDDWKKLELFTGLPVQRLEDSGWRGTKGQVLKSTEYSGNPATDNYGFGALPAGYRMPTGGYNYFNTRTGFWTSTSIDGTTGVSRGLRNNYNGTNRQVDTEAGYGYSIRCIRIPIDE